jgi:hypothetical protein
MVLGSEELITTLNAYPSRLKEVSMMTSSSTEWTHNTSIFLIICIIDWRISWLLPKFSVKSAETKG